MYPVTAPASTCDIKTGRDQDHSKGRPDTGELTLVRNAHSAAEFRKTLQRIDPSELAAKILKMHTAAEKKQASELRRGALISRPDHDAHDMPEFLQRTARVAGQPDTQLELQEALPANSGKAQGGPGLRLLLASTLMIGLAGGAALALGLPVLMTTDSTGTSSAATGLVMVETAGSPFTAQAPESQAKTEAAAEPPSATPAQIAMAKTRIKNAFAAGITAEPRPLPPAVPADEIPVAPSGPVASVAVTEVEAASEKRADLQPAETGYSALARTAPAVAIPPYLASSVKSTELAAAEAGDRIAVITGASEEVRGSSSNAERTVSESPYPNSGRTLAAVNLRRTETRNGKIITVIPKNAQVNYSDCGVWWCRVAFQGQTGFIGQRFLARTAP